MRLKELAELALIARKTARRVGSEFRFNHARLLSMGVSAADVGKVELAVKDIEDFTAERLAALERS